MESNAAAVEESAAARFAGAVEHGLATGDWEPLDEWALAESRFVYDSPLAICDPLPPGVFDRMLAYLGDARLWRDPNAFRVLWVVQQNWNALAEEEKGAVLDAVAAAYPRFTAERSRDALAGLAGRFAADRRALGVLRDLLDPGVSAEEASRAALAYGLRELARCARDEAVAREAVALLRATGDDDPSDLVRRESGTALESLRDFAPALLDGPPH